MGVIELVFDHIAAAIPTAAGVESSILAELTRMGCRGLTTCRGPAVSQGLRVMVPVDGQHLPSPQRRSHRKALPPQVPGAMPWDCPRTPATPQIPGRYSVPYRSSRSAT